MTDVELTTEQAYVDRLYTRLDELRAGSAAELAAVRKAGSVGTPAARSERDARSTMLEDRIARFNAVEHGLVFGRVDKTTGETHYVGRIGLSSDEYERLLIDWRAPAARPFYAATPSAPLNVTRRRHLRIRNRQVLGIDDDVFDLAALDGSDRTHLSGEAALLAALREGRTGRMRDIVATIQSEQDAVIRSELTGVLVVQGGPGTGKTAVALHRAAYLLYEHRDRLANSGVLVVGPNDVFLTYIEQVLPALGETGVVMSTVDGLYPGVEVTASESTEVAAVKGDLRMVDVVAELVRSCQRLPEQPVEIAYGRHRLRLDPALVKQARTKARRSRRPHNQARATFQRQVYGALAAQALEAIGASPGKQALDDTASEQLATDEVAAAVDRLWPYLTPERVLAACYATASLRDLTATALEPAERELLQRPRDHGWTSADVPLLDELAERLGPIPAKDPLSHLRAEEERVEADAATEVLGQLELAFPLDANQVVERYQGPQSRRTAADRAAGDRSWTFGHVIVDEAQELSPMAWRMLQRRCPLRSMTVVGDLAQASVPWRPARWQDALGDYARDRLRVAQLTVNYRTPTEIMDVAGAVLRSADPAAEVPESIRAAETAPWSLQVPRESLAEALTKIVADEAAQLTEGMTAVVVPDDLGAEIDRRLAADVPHLVRAQRLDLDSPVVVLDVARAKGLEFDSVIVVEPATILTAAPGGAHDLYVALSRATKRLGVVHTGDLPEPLHGLARHAG
ncbi:MAG: AAA family ATPase [Streptosporangiales bacterium]|nr:AAA family ATPase [Streptosporangiales bacterium]